MNQIILVIIHLKLLFMKKITILKSIVAVCFVLLSLSFSKKDSSEKSFCGPSFFMSNCSGNNPEVYEVTFSHSGGQSSYYRDDWGDACFGGPSYFAVFGNSTTYTITVEVESDWNGSGTPCRIGIKIGNTVVQCQQYYYGQGVYTFELYAGCFSSYTIFTESAYC